MQESAGAERSFLDPPDAEGWSRVAAVGHRMVEDVVHQLGGLDEQRVWRPVPDATRAFLRRPMAEEPTPLEAVYDEVRDHILGYGPGGIHPRFWGWVTGTGTVTGALAELLAGAMNGPAGLFNDVTGEVELAVLDWCKAVTGMPPEASGTITSGASVANLVGLQVALEAHAPDVRLRGVAALERRPVAYASTEVHSSILKAMATLGLGWDALRRIPADGDYRLPGGRAGRGHTPGPGAGPGSHGGGGLGGHGEHRGRIRCHPIADLCAAEGLWLHVDGAVGALARMAPSVAGILDGVRRADSLAFDFHKWLYVPYEAGCVLVRNEAVHRRTFEVPSAAYLAAIPRGLGGPSLRAGDLGVQLSRGFKALKVWMSLREAGVARYRSAMERNIALARWLEAEVQGAPDLELAHATDLCIVCFRYLPEDGAEQDGGPAADAVNREILMALQERGIAAPSHTHLGGRFFLRCAITNHRTRTADLQLLLDSAAARTGALGPCASMTLPTPIPPPTWPR